MTVRPNVQESELKAEELSAGEVIVIRPGEGIVLDKTVTLTMGVPAVTGIRTADGATEHQVLQNAAITEQHSEHPLGEAVIRNAKAANVSLREYSLRYFEQARA